MNNELTHHGVKGMKWGVRRARERVGSGLAKFRRKRRGEDAEVNKASIKSKKPKSVKDMSDEELVSAINRLRLEKSYKDALSANSEVPKGKKYMSMMLDKSVEGAAEGMKNAMRIAFDVAVKKYTGENDATAKLKKATEELELKKRKTEAEDYFTNREKKRAEETSEENRAKRDAEYQRNKWTSAKMEYERMDYEEKIRAKKEGKTESTTSSDSKQEAKAKTEEVIKNTSSSVMNDSDVKKTGVDYINGMRYEQMSFFDD